MTSFYYPDKHAFFRDAYEVLKPHGVFLITYGNFSYKFDDIYHLMKRYFVIESEEDITENVLRSM